MESKTENRKWKNAGRFPAELLFMTGIFCGKCVAKSDLENGVETENPGFFLSDPQLCRKRYFRRSLFPGSAATKRRIFFFCCFLCGFTIFGVPLTVAYMLFLGIETGMILALSVLEFGIYGGVAGAGLLMPQYLVYIPAYFYLAGIVYRQSYGIWKNYGLVPQKTGAYFRQGITVFLLYTGGILAESFLNPWIVEKVIKGLKFF